MELIKKEIGYENPLKERKEKMNKTREELARLSVVPVPAITAYEMETADLSRLAGETLYCLAKALGCTIEDLIR